MSFAMSSDMAADGVSSGIACIDSSEDIPAMTGRETGANASPVAIRIASRRRMAKLRFTNLDSHKFAAMESHPQFAIKGIPT